MAKKTSKQTQVDRDWDAFCSLIEQSISSALSTIPLSERAAAAKAMNATLTDGKPTPFNLPPGRCVVPPAVAEDALSKGMCSAYVDPVSGVMSIPAHVYASHILSVEEALALLECTLDKLATMKQIIKDESLKGQVACKG